MMEQKTLTNYQKKSEAGKCDYTVLNGIVEKAVSGDREALIELCDEIMKDVLFRSVYIMGNETDGEDVSQEVMIRVCEKIKTLREPTAFNAWLGRIITNEVNRYHRKNSKFGALLDIEDSGMSDIIVEERESVIPHEFVENEECRSTVMEIISTLSLRQRQAVMFHYYDDLSITKTAEVMGVSQQNVSQLLRSARKRLKVGLEAKNFKVENASASAVLPVGLFLSDVLIIEAAAFGQTYAVAISTTLAACTEAVLAGGSTAVAEAAAVANAARNTGGLSDTAVGFLVAGATVVITALVVILGLTLGGYYADVPIEVSGTIVFSGGIDRQDGTIYINPEHAYLEIDSSGGDAEILYWWIALPGEGADAIFSGDGDYLGNVLLQMQAAGMSGEHWLYFRLMDESGALIRMSRNFYILN